MDEARQAVVSDARVTDLPEPSAPSDGDAAGEKSGRKAVLGAGAELDPWKKVEGLALKQLNRFIMLEPKVLRGDDPDSIHDMRVASRRLQQILDLLHPQPRPRDVRALRRKIRRARRCLSEVRNCDVLLGSVQKSLSRKRASRREVWTGVQEYLRQRRAESFEEALRKLGKVNLAVLYVQLRGHLSAERNGASPAHPVPHDAGRGSEQFYQRVGESLDSLWRAFEAQVALSESDPQAPIFHGARIATKRLRYLVEVIAEFGVPGSAETLVWLRKLQQHLGDWHDREVLEEMMIQMVARPDYLRDNLKLAMGVEKLIARNRAIKKKFEEKYFAMVLDSAEVQRLKHWAGHLISSPSAAFAKA